MEGSLPRLLLYGDLWSGVRALKRRLGESAGSAPWRFAFVGDSGNDAPCFAAFRTTFGVANVRASLGRLVVPPRYVAARTMGEGFADVAAAILDKRRVPPREARQARVC